MLFKVRCNTPHSQKGFSLGGGAGSGNLSGTGSGSRPSTPLRHLQGETTSSNSSMSFNTSAVASVGAMDTFGLSNTQFASSSTVGNTSVSLELLNHNDVDAVMAAWAQQMQNTPLSLPPKNTQTLPSSVFLSYDFIYWLMRNVNTLDDVRFLFLISYFTFYLSLYFLI